MRGDRRLQLLQDHHSLFQSFQSFLSSTLFHSLRFNRWFIKEIGMIRIIVAKIFVFLPIFDRSIVGQLRLEKGPQSSNSTNDVIALLDPSIGRRPNSIRTIVRPGSHLRIRTRVRIIILRDDESSKSRKIDKPKSWTEEKNTFPKPFETFQRNSNPIQTFPFQPLLFNGYFFANNNFSLSFS